MPLSFPDALIRVNSLGQRPIGVTEPLQVCVSYDPRQHQVGAPGPAAAKVGPERSRPPPPNLPQGHGDLLFAMDPVDAFTITP